MDNSPNQILPAPIRVGLALGLACAAQTCFGQADYNPDWTKNFRIGAVSGFNIKGSFSLGGQFPVAGNMPGVYDDGYVLVDETGNAGGYTSHWGYETADQYDEGSQQLLMHSTTSFTGTGSGSGENDFSVGAELAYGGVIRQWERMRLGWELGFAWLPTEISDSSPISAQVERDTYAFDTSGIMVMPGHPYSGGPSGLGPTIHDTATLLGTDTATAEVLGSRQLEMDLFIFRFGPTMFFDVSREVGLSLSAGPAVALISQTYSYNEAVTFDNGSTASNRGSFSDSTFVYGAYVNVIGTYHLEENGDIYLGLQYMPLSDAGISQSGREASADFSGQIMISAGISWTF